MNIRLCNIKKRFSSQFAIEDLDMLIENGKFTTFLGPSGCGKTTILRMIAGLETPDEGEIWFDEQCIFSSKQKINIPPENRNLGFVFQDFALWPHMTIFENIAFPLRAKHETGDLKNKVNAALKAVKLEGFENRYPEQLSGGQQQRVAFARAIVANPQCILFDEPLSALDAILREEMRGEIRRLTSLMGITSVFVTHDQTEAMSMSDQIFILNKGSIEQCGTPEETYRNPETKFVAGFIGKSNWVDDDTMFRPEALLLDTYGKCETFEGRIIDQQFIGNTYEIHLDVNGKKWVVLSPMKQQDETMLVRIDKKQLKHFKESIIA